MLYAKSIRCKVRAIGLSAVPFSIWTDWVESMVELCPHSGGTPVVNGECLPLAWPSALMCLLLVAHTGQVQEHGACTAGES